MKLMIKVECFRHLAILCCLLLAGCTTIIKTPESLYLTSKNKVIKPNISAFQNFEAIGKMGFSDGKQGGNASIVWEQHPESYQIRLYGPLGSGAIQIKGHRGQISLTRADGKVITANTPEALLQKELGWVIPVSGLRYWLRGLPAPGATPTKMLLDASQRLWQIEQQGWTIVYESYKSTGNRDVPYKLLLRNGPIRLKFIFNRWKLN